MGWIIVGIVGGTIFVILVTFLLNTPESIMKAIVNPDDDEEKESAKSSDSDDSKE